MVESKNFTLEDGRQVYSLYAETRAPSTSMLEGLDAVLVDLPDVGTRVYTFAQTLALFMKKAGELSLPIIILDRPNPIGGVALEGNILDEDMYSFVGLSKVPMRHGFTLAEYALFINSALAMPCPLTVIPMWNWQRDMYFKDTALPWVLPSPNMPSPTTAHIYPGAVLFEGTNVSEGRGTTKPFHLIGAPYLDAQKLCSDLSALKLKGVAFREASFEPCFQKWASQVCYGVEIFPLDKSFKPFLTGLSILEAIIKRYPKDFKLKEPPYEYEFVRRPLDLIIGRKKVTDELLAGKSAREISQDFNYELSSFAKRRQDFLLYA
jgi:uncharacterized protein YbbC (DUF1343 family)